MFDSVRVGDPVKRLPCGYACSVRAVDQEGARLKIHDPHANRTFWLSRRVFESQWCGYACPDTNQPAHP